MTSSQRIILNTLATYSTSILAAGLALFSSRWILDGLGEVDFGLYTLVGTLIVFVSLLNSILAGSAQRHFAFAIGQGDREAVNQWFNTAAALHTILPLLLVALGWPVGEFCVRHLLTIPADRVTACVSVFRLSLLVSFISMAAVPYVGMFTAKQRIAEIALWGAVQSLLMFGLALGLSHMSGDRLLIYAFGLVAISSGVTLIQVFRAAFIFPECRLTFHYCFNRARAQALFGFASWSLIGALGGVLRNQGTGILLNVYYGPRVNAAYGIANQVSSQTGSLAQAVMGAMAPEITTTAGRNDRPHLLVLSLRASKFCTLVALVFSIPLLLEMDYVLHLWLKTPPTHAAVFCQFVLLSFLLDKLTIGHTLSINANGTIAAYQGTVGLLLLSTLPVGYLLLKLFAVPSAALVAFLLTGVACALGRIYWGKHLLGLTARSWLTGVLGRCLLVALPAAVLAAMPQFFLPASGQRLVLTLVLSFLLIPVLGWGFGLTPLERQYFTQHLRKLPDQLRRRWRPCPAANVTLP
jgi:O-antigen/teichoic acid export membrane protein